MILAKRGAVVCGGGGGAEGHVLLLLRAPELGRALELRLPEHRKSSRSSAIRLIPNTKFFFQIRPLEVL